ncbi:hypothetical protein P7B02_15205 [Caulobacter segnis]|uniref:hypothetical protein n=1 Tax=Caulobacter segnis TaxID=88688 RepID=UPI0024107EE4|nr:hypothetical protein [Caulobacter segnis]MDG2522883.1 hypothetical protein [Caulobacter segnis]
MDEAGHKLTPDQEERFSLVHGLMMAWITDGPEVVDGVVFDLTCDVDKAEWHPLAFLGFHTSRAAFQGPELVFPWTQPSIRSYLAEVIEPIDVARGSLVTIAYVEDRTFKSAFADFADGEQVQAKVAHLVVLTPDKEVIPVKRPMVLLTEAATETLIDYEDYGAAYRGLIKRLERLSGLVELDDLADLPFDAWPSKPRPMPEAYSRALYTLTKAKRLTSIDTDAAYVAFGYMMAKAEAQEQLLESANRGRDAKASQRKAVSGRKAASQAIKDRIIAQAAKIITHDGDISLSKCSRLVADALAADPTWKHGKDPKWFARHLKEALFEPRGKNGEFRPIRRRSREGLNSG